MIRLETEFVSGECGHSDHPLTYRLLKRTEKVAIYERSRDGKARDYEVFLIKIVPKGTEYKFPNGIVKVVEDDTERYPSTSQWGTIAWSYTTIGCAMHHFYMLSHGQNIEEVQESLPPKEDKPQKIKSSNDEIQSSDISDSSPVDQNNSEEVEEKVYKGPDLLIPVGEFSTKELAEHNKVQYPIAFLFLKDQEKKGTIKFSRKERRAAKGKPTSLFSKVTS